MNIAEKLDTIKHALRRVETRLAIIQRTNVTILLWQAWRASPLWSPRMKAAHGMPAFNYGKALRRLGAGIQRMRQSGIVLPA
jgi:hypothetical protein